MASKRKVTSKARKLQAELGSLGKKIDAVAAEVRKTEAAARAGTLQQLRLLQRKQAAARRALARLGRQSAAASVPIMAGLQKAWHDIDLAIGQGIKRFRQTA
jgi:hypothetical protein